MRDPARSTPRRLLLFVSTLLASVPATAQPPDPLPCSTLAIDATAENGFTIGSGEMLREFCSPGFVSKTDGGFNCLWGGRYQVPEVVTAWTAVAAQPPSNFQFKVRIPNATAPGHGLYPGPIDAFLPALPVFPAWILALGDLTPTLPSAQYFLLRFSLVQSQTSLVYACARLGPLASGRFLTVDRSPGTPLTLALTRADGGAWEPVTNGDPAARAIGVGAHIAPFAAYGSPGFVQPRSGGSATGSLLGWYTGTPLPASPPPGDNFFRFRIVHDVPNPTAVHLHVGRPTRSGPVVFDFPNPQSPIDVAGIQLSAAEIQALAENRLYFDVHSAAHPEGELRGQIVPAQPPIFSDGFESGDTSAWSATQP